MKGSLAGLVMMAFLIVGCAFLPAPAPEVSPAIMKQANAPKATLISGRRILAERCASCHVLVPVASHSPTEWKKILAVMAPRARLNAEQTVQVDAYLTATSTALHR